MIKAFTYLELIIVIVLTSIIVSAGYYAITILGKQNNIVQEKYSEVQKLSLFDLKLKRAFSQALEIEVKGNELILSSQKGIKQKLEIDEDFIVVSDSQSDTLFCQVSEFIQKEEGGIALSIEYMNQSFELNYGLE